MNTKTVFLFFIALVLISVSFRINSVWLSLMGGAFYGWGAYAASRYGLDRLSAAVHKAGLSDELNTLLNRVNEELSNGR